LSNQHFSVVFIQQAVFPKMVSLKLTSYGDPWAAQIVVRAACSPWIWFFITIYWWICMNLAASLC